MLTVLSPAKKLSKDCFVKTDQFHKPQFLDESKALVGKMKKMTPTDFMSLMAISENLAELNWERMQNWDERFNPENSREAIFSFKGDTYSGLDADSLSDQDLNFAQKNRVYKGLGQIVFMNRKTTYDIDDDLIDSDINALKSPQHRRYKKLENSEGSNDENS